MEQMVLGGTLKGDPFSVWKGEIKNAPNWVQEHPIGSSFMSEEGEWEMYWWELSTDGGLSWRHSKPPLPPGEFRKPWYTEVSSLASNKKQGEK
jgi:hypothetical protein